MFNVKCLMFNVACSIDSMSSKILIEEVKDLGSLPLYFSA